MGDAFFDWLETYAVGHSGLDSEHKHLVGLINEISGVPALRSGLQQIARLSNAFYLASVEHFRQENSVMRDIMAGTYRLPDEGVHQLVAMSEAAINDHYAEHARTLIQLERMLQAFIATKDLHGPTLASELRVWFLDHATNHDAHLKKIFQRYNDRWCD